MSRSYRRPYGTYSSIGSSAHTDKTLAARAVRRRQNAWLRDNYDDDGGLVPHRYECSHNEVYGWSRDGRQFLMVPSAREWSYHCESLQGFRRWGSYAEWPPRWYVEITRK